MVEAVVRVALYIRVSTREQAKEGYSLAAQEAVLRAHCSQKGYEVVTVYADEGISAKDIKHRPAMRELLADASRHEFNRVLVWKLSRFSRSVIDLCTSCDLLEQHGVYFESCSESFDCASAMGRMVRGILAVIAQWEREIIGENVKIAMRERAKQGKMTCSYVLGYDREEESFVVNSREAQIVREIYALYEQHKNVSTVARICQNIGYKGKRGGVIKPESVQKILTRFLYCGFYSYERIPHPAPHEPIVSIEQYNRVQDLMAFHGGRAGRIRTNPLVWLQIK